MSRKSHCASFFFKAADNAFLVLFIGGILINFTRSDISRWEAFYLIATGSLLALVFLFIGVLFTPKN
ncbi:MAG: hypothetical protein LBU08_04110 [Tannerellaceae bacterium]|jgi:hypothetical protein|nr:hypothetical protein [Tannerellaceae bacterium]